MSSFSLDGSDDSRLWSVIENNHDMYQREILETRQSLSDRHQKKLRLTATLNLKCVKAVAGLVEMEVVAVAAVRRDLGLSFNEDDYRETVTAINTSVMNSAKKFYDQIVPEEKLT